MDLFLYIGDYYRAIQGDPLQQLIGSQPQRLQEATQAALSEVSDLLKGKYDMETSLKPISQHDKTKTYNAGATVYLNATAYSATATYAVGAQVLQNGFVYSCKTAITVGEAFTLAKWDLLGAQYDIFNSVQPYDTFDYLKIYKANDIVFWKDKIYTCKIATQILDHQAQINLGVQVASNIVNVFPDDEIKGEQYWGVGVAYNVPTNTLITNATFWQVGDNRDQKLLQVCVDVALYHLHSRISPRNVPDLRVVRYMGEPSDRIASKNKIIYPLYSALGWCQNVRSGDDTTPSMPEIQPKQGGRILSTSRAKLNNTY